MCVQVTRYEIVGKAWPLARQQGETKARTRRFEAHSSESGDVQKE